MKPQKQNPYRAIVALGLLMSCLFIFNSCKKNQTADPLKPGNLSGISNRSLPVLIIPTTISNGLIAYWTCANTTYDLSGNGNNATLHSITNAADRFGHVNGAFHFNGTTSYMHVLDAAALRLNNTDFTVNVWVNMHVYNTSLGSQLLSKHSPGNNNGWSYSITGDGDTTKYVQFFGPGGTMNNAYGRDTVTLSTWHMLTSIYSLAHHSIKFYLDGVLDDTVANVASPNALNTASLYIGRDSTSGYFFHGLMSDIRIYNRAINTTELSTLYHATTAPTDGLLAFWPLTKTPNDLSGNGNNGTNSGGVSATTDRFGNPIGSYQFNGTTSYITVHDTTPLRLNNTNFTVNAWVHLANYNSSFGSQIMNKHLTGLDHGWTWSISGDSAVTKYVQFFGPGGSSTNNVYGSTVVPTGTWHMVTVTYTLTGGSLSIYVDGVLDKTVTGIASPDALENAALYIGRDNPGVPTSGYFFHGHMSDLRMYNRVLNATEIGQLLNALD